MLSKIKKALNKQEHQIVSVEEFCTYIGLPYGSARDDNGLRCGVVELESG